MSAWDINEFVNHDDFSNYDDFLYQDKNYIDNQDNEYFGMRIKSLCPASADILAAVEASEVELLRAGEAEGAGSNPNALDADPAPATNEKTLSHAQN